MNVGLPNLRALIFQGYGSLSAYEAGAFKTLFENLSEKDNERNQQVKPLFDIVVGTGMGAVNAAILASLVKENKTWQGSPERLIQFWYHISTKYDIADKDPLFEARWEELRKTNPDIATPDAARRYFAAKDALNIGANEVSAPSPKADNKFLDPQNIWNLYDTNPLRKNIERFVKFPIATSFENGEPRLLLVCTDVLEGTAVAFDSYGTVTKITQDLDTLEEDKNYRVTTR
jgi:NTE family protein